MNTSSESALPALNSTQVTENLLHAEVATIWSSVANMTNNVLGAGLVALPYSISQVHISLVFKWSVHSFLESFCLF